MQSTKFALIPVVALASTILVTVVFGLSQIVVFDPPYLYFALNIVFWTLASFAIMFVSIKGYVQHGSRTVLIISNSVLILGLSLIIVGFVLPISANIAITIGGICYFAAALLQFSSSIISLTRNDKTRIANKKLVLILSYVGTLVFIGLIYALAFLGVFPAFFTSAGPTLLRQVIVASNALFFGLSSIVFGLAYLRSRSAALVWYALAIGLIAIGALSSLATRSIGDIPTWVTRIGFYVGTIYLLVAIIKSRSTVNDVYGGWAEAFSTNRRQLTDLFANMLDAFVYGKVITDKAGKPIDWIYLDVNDSFERITGLKKEQVMGKKVTQIFPSEHKDEAQWIVKNANVALTMEPAQFEVYRQSIKKWISASVYSPKRGYFVSIFEDITQRKQAEEALNQAQAKLQEYATNLELLVEERTRQLQEKERLAAIGQVAGMVGHDIRNPLQAIVSELYFARQAIDEMPKDKVKQDALESVNIIQEQVDYINKIVSDLQDYAKTLKPELVEADICQLISEALKTMVVPENIQLSVACEDVPKLMVDLTFMRRILINLVSNAIQAMPDGGKLTVKAFKEEDKALITVKDTGVGIAKEAQDKIFTPLFTTKAKGQGFGLVVVKRMTEALGGTISFESEAGKGTTFTISLPAKES